MSLLDRNRQREILTLLAKLYPDQTGPGLIADKLGTPLAPHDHEFLAEVTYLAEHGLITFKSTKVERDPTSPLITIIVSMAITAKGMDFLQDDGGLSAILGTVIVKLHDDTIKALLIDKIAASEGDPSAKGRLVDTIRSLPAEVTKSISMRLIERGLTAAPQKLAELQILLGL